MQTEDLALTHFGMRTHVSPAPCFANRSKPRFEGSFFPDHVESAFWGGTSRTETLFDRPGSELASCEPAGALAAMITGRSCLHSRRSSASSTSALETVANNSNSRFSRWTGGGRSTPVSYARRPNACYSSLAPVSEVVATPVTRTANPLLLDSSTQDPKER
jgi:hypothetical protein